MPEHAIQLTWHANYELKLASKPKRLGILLHGYQQRGTSTMRALNGCFDADTVLLAPDGLFPVADTSRDELRLGFTWYFFDIKTGRYLTPMARAVDYVVRVVDALKLGSLPKIIVGYSQGGYLAPHLAQAFEDVSQVIGLNCRFRSEALKPPFSFPIHGIHGAADQMVDPQRAARCHAELIAAGAEGTFHAIEGAGHGIGPKHRDRLSQLLAEGWS